MQSQSLVQDRREVDSASCSSPSSSSSYFPPQYQRQSAEQKSVISREEKASALPESPDLSALVESCSDRTADYEDEKDGYDTARTTGENPSPSTQRDAQNEHPGTVQEQGDEQAANKEEQGHNQGANTLEEDIRSDSIMTSRWLSFGRVLFSPAHGHVMSKNCERLLVIDGLMNNDWSLYCALTYPSAEVFSLSIDPSLGAFDFVPSSQPLQLPCNHFTIRHADLEKAFPFPNGYFSATILRFPGLWSETAQRNVVSECKRVLRSGGYMEMSLLDLDMVNMGSHARKSVRALKERTCLADPSISLKPASDSFQRLLATYSFDNLRKCVVRIPVTSGSVRSSMDSTRSRSSSASTMEMRYADGSELVKLLSDPSPSPAVYEAIANIVSKVGRWWYSRCYDDHRHTAIPGIWSDQKLLRECHQQGTCFRLLIGYAQKPSEVPRRTASV